MQPPDKRHDDGRKTIPCRHIRRELAQSRLGLPKSLTGVFQGLLLFTLLACDTLIAYRVRFTGFKKNEAR